MSHKLTIEQVAEAFELLESGVYKENLCEIFSVSRNTLDRYLRGAKRYGFSFWTNEPSEEPRLDPRALLEENQMLRTKLSYLENMLRDLTKYAGEM